MKFAPISVEFAGDGPRAIKKSGCCEIVLATVDSRDGERLKGTLKQNHTCRWARVQTVPTGSAVCVSES